MRVGSLFAGIGGFEAGMRLADPSVEVVWQAELAEFPRRVLAARFPHARLLGDVRDITAATVEPVDVITAGFPCQPVSQAGRGLAQQDERWLWPEVARIIGELHPRIVLLENVRGLLGRGLHDVLVDLAELGYGAQWDLISAAAVGAPHRRERVWIVAYPDADRIGQVFTAAPPVFAWPPEELFLPRLTRDAVERKHRLTALGNAVVPANVAHVWQSVRHALTAPPVVPSGLFGSPLTDWQRAEMPVAGMLVAGLVHEADTTAARITTRLWPTATAQEVAWSLQALAACIDKNGQPARDPHERFYHPETGQIVQRTLYNYALGVEHGLWPTPPDLNPTLWPTPTSGDSVGSRRATARRDTWTSNPGTTLTDAAWIAEGIDPHAVPGQRAEGELLWPTPHGMSAAAGGGSYDGHGNELSMAVRVAEGVSDSERTAKKLGLWPTPSSRDEKGPSGAGFLDRRNGGPDLPAAVIEAERDLWPTPKASPSGPDYARAGRDGSGGDDLATAAARTGAAGSLSPVWVEWLMGYPAGWTDPTIATTEAAA